MNHLKLFNSCLLHENYYKLQLWLSPLANWVCQPPSAKKEGEKTWSKLFLNSCYIMTGSLRSIHIWRQMFFRHFWPTYLPSSDTLQHTLMYLVKSDEAWPTLEFPIQQYEILILFLVLVPPTWPYLELLVY